MGNDLLLSPAMSDDDNTSTNNDEDNNSTYNKNKSSGGQRQRGMDIDAAPPVGLRATEDVENPPNPPVLVATPHVGEVDMPEPTMEEARVLTAMGFLKLVRACVREGGREGGGDRE